jgi:hypothetical protein
LPYSWWACFQLYSHCKVIIFWNCYVKRNVSIQFFPRFSAFKSFCWVGHTRE